MQCCTYSLIGAGGFVGLGVVVMHYMGMAALKVSGEIVYRPGLFSLSHVALPFPMSDSLYGLEPDGRVDPATFAAIDAALAGG